MLNVGKSMAKRSKRKTPEKPKLHIPALTVEMRKRYAKLLVTLLAAVLTFVGPTYLLYVLRRFALPHTLLVLLGLASFTAGMALLMQLVKGEEKAKAST